LSISFLKKVNSLNKSIAIVELDTNTRDDNVDIDAESTSKKIGL
jgi:hypothetical protein